MKRVLLLVVSSILAAACSIAQRSQQLVNDALQAMGGPISGVVGLKASMKVWEPEQSHAPGGEMRFAHEAHIDVIGDLSRGLTRIDWVKNFQYPTTRTFKFSEIVTPEAGWVIGIDSNFRNKQNRESNPPAHAMSGLRLANSQRELLRASTAVLLAEMRANPDRLTDAPGNAVGYKRGNVEFIVSFDPQTRLPARIRSLDYDNVWGDVNFDLVLSDWRTLGALRVAASQKYELNGRVIIELRVTDASAGASIPANHFEPPAAVKAGAPKPASGNVPYQWVLRRQFIGVYTDSDHVSYDTRAGTGLRLVEVAPGVQHQSGGTHHSLVVEMRDHLIVMDAPVDDSQSNWTIKAAKEKYPGKPIRYLVMTHHHMDHSGGLRAYAAEGATLVVGAGAAGHYRKVLSAPFTRNPDLASRDLSGTRIMEVADRQVFGDGKREFVAYLIDNPHAASTLMGYVADARIGYVTDIWSPGAGPLPGKIIPPLAAVVNAVKKAGISPLKFVGGHGTVFDYAPLERLANQ